MMVYNTSPRSHRGKSEIAGNVIAKANKAVHDFVLRMITLAPIGNYDSEEQIGWRFVCVLPW